MDLTLDQYRARKKFWAEYEKEGFEEDVEKFAKTKYGEDAEIILSIAMDVDERRDLMNRHKAISVMEANVGCNNLKSITEEIKEYNSICKRIMNKHN